MKKIIILSIVCIGAIATDTTAMFKTGRRMTPSGGQRTLFNQPNNTHRVPFQTQSEKRLDKERRESYGKLSFWRQWLTPYNEYVKQLEQANDAAEQKEYDSKVKDVEYLYETSDEALKDAEMKLAELLKKQEKEETRKKKLSLTYQTQEDILKRESREKEISSGIKELEGEIISRKADISFYKKQLKVLMGDERYYDESKNDNI